MTRYSHSSLVAHDWRLLAKFYEEVFGCVRVPPERHHSGDWLARGTGIPTPAVEGVHMRLPGHGDQGPTIEILTWERSAWRPAPALNRPGYGHLAFEVDDVAASLEALLNAGGGKLGEVVQRQVPGAGLLTFVYARDPEGNVVELQTWG